MKTILHLCADIGSDSIYYQRDENYTVIKIGKEIGVENYHPPEDVYGVIANPPCTEFSTAQNFKKVGDLEVGLELVNHCQRIISECGNLKFWVIENPANGRLKEFLGTPAATYQPYEYGDGWTKKTALWGQFNMPPKVYTWETCPKIDGIYTRPTRGKPSLAFLHKSAIDNLQMYEWAKPFIKCDADLRSLCSDGFALAFYQANQ